MFTTRSLHGTKDSSNNSAADTNKCYHHNEPSDADGLRHGDSTACLRRLRMLMRMMGMVRMLSGCNHGLTRNGLRVVAVVLLCPAKIKVIKDLIKIFFSFCLEIFMLVQVI